MKATRLSYTKPLVTLAGALSGQSGGIGPGGQVPTSNGSNVVAWGSNVANIFSNSSNKLLGPDVNFLSGAGIAFSQTSNSLTISTTGGGGGGGGGAPTTVDYLVGTADPTLSAEIVVGTTPGGELGGTWASPTVDTVHAGSAHPSFGAAVAPGTVTLATERFLVQYTHLKIASTDRLTMAGTARVILDDLSTDTAELILGTPKIVTSFVVPSDYFLDQLTRLTLRDNTRATLRGTADLVLTDDFNSRSRIVLAGRG